MLMQHIVQPSVLIGIVLNFHGIMEMVFLVIHVHATISVINFLSSAHIRDSGCTAYLLNVIIRFYNNPKAQYIVIHPFYGIVWGITVILDQTGC